MSEFGPKDTEIEQDYQTRVFPTLYRHQIVRFNSQAQNHILFISMVNFRNGLQMGVGKVR